MALRELFATFTFEFDRKTLAAAERATVAVEQKVQGLAQAFDRATGRARSTGGLTAWANIAKAAGVGAQAFRAALGTMQAQLARAAAGEAKLASAAQELGLDLARATAAGRSQSSVWAEIVGRLSRVEDASKRARLALALLGDAGAQVAIPAAALGPAGLRTARRVATPEAPKAPQVAPALGALERLRLAYAKHNAAVAEAGQKTTWYETRLRRVKEQGVGPVGQLITAAFWTGLAYSVYRAGESLARLGLRLGTDITREAYAAAEAVEAYKKSLGAISGLGEQKGAAELRHVREEVKRYGLDFEPAIQAYQKLRIAGFSTADALDYSTKAAADFKDAQGATNEQVEQLQTLLVRVKTSGLTGEALEGLRSAGISQEDILGRIAEKLGVTAKKAKELASQGKLPKDVALAAIREQTLARFGQKEFGAASDALGTSLRGSLGKAKAGFKDWMLSLGETLTPGFTHLAEVIGGTLSRFQADGTFQAATDAIVRVLTDLIDLVEIHWPRVERILRRGTQGGAQALGGLASSLDAMIDSFLTAVEWVQDNWPQISATISDACTVAKYAIAGIIAAKTLSGLVTAAAFLRKIGADAREAAGLARALAGALGVSGAALGAITAAVVAWGVAVYQAVQLWNEWDTSVVVAKLKSDWAGLVSWLGGIWDAALATLTGGLDRAYQIGSDTAAELRRGFVDALGPVAGALGLERGVEGGEPASANLRGLSQTRTYEPRAQMPVLHSRAVTLTDQRTTTINVSGAQAPAATGKAVSTAVTKTQTADLGAMQAALVGAAP